MDIYCILDMDLNNDVQHMYAHFRIFLKNFWCMIHHIQVGFLIYQESN